MKIISFISVIILSVAILCSPIFASNEKTSEEYVYVIEVKGEVNYFKSQAEKTPAGMLRRMQIIPSGTVLQIVKDASISLTCPGCKTIHLTQRNSPFTVNMSDFKKDRKDSGEMVKYFASALKSFFYPESKLSHKVFMGHRGIIIPTEDQEKKQINPLWPSGHILPVGAKIAFIWTSTSMPFFLEIKEAYTNKIIYTERKISSNRINISVELFEPGRDYEWTVFEERTGRSYHESFILLPKDEKTKILKILQELPSLLPTEVDHETKCRLQAGYLLSDNLFYDAWHWLEIHGIGVQW